MEKLDAVAGLAALAQENRLDVFRLLVQAGPDGMPAGEIADTLGLAPNTLTFHFDRLRMAGLVSVRREGRSMIYAARFDTMNDVLAYLTENCCQGRRGHCLPVHTQPIPCRRKDAPKRESGMRLYMFEHCSLCFRVRMIAALKRIHLQESVVLDDDTATMVGLVGKRQIPILVKDDGQPMLESMEMVRYVDGVGGSVLSEPQRPEVAAWADNVVAKMAPLTMPRYPLLGLPEFGTIAALDHYNLRKRKAFGDFAELRANTRHYIRDMLPDVDALDRLIESPTAINGKLSLDDILVLPLLRSAAIVKGLQFPRKVREYFETMMAVIGHEPLPAI